MSVGRRAPGWLAVTLLALVAACASASRAAPSASGDPAQAAAAQNWK